LNAKLALSEVDDVNVVATVLLAMVVRLVKVAVAPDMKLVPVKLMVRAVAEAAKLVGDAAVSVGPVSEEVTVALVPVRFQPALVHK
jgi:hypothetical protein